VWQRNANDAPQTSLPGITGWNLPSKMDLIHEGMKRFSSCRQLPVQQALDAHNSTLPSLLIPS
jgi:hypothetical protein